MVVAMKAYTIPTIEPVNVGPTDPYTLETVVTAIVANEITDGDRIAEKV